MTSPTPFNVELARPLIKQALAEDVGFGDISTLSVVEEVVSAQAIIFPKEPCILAGADVARLAFEETGAPLKITVHHPDGSRLQPGIPALTVEGSARAILIGERTALNFIQRLSGTATMTRRYVDAVAGTKAKIIDTRKTTPNLRILEKYAVTCGGGENHRRGLYDQVLLKDNHLKLMRRTGDASFKKAVSQARTRFPGKIVEIETETLEDVSLALEAGADIIMLDNMPPSLMREAVTLINGRAKVEASGGITLDNVRAAAETGVDYISIGALTHSVRAIDFSLEISD